MSIRTQVREVKSCILLIRLHLYELRVSVKDISKLKIQNHISLICEFTRKPFVFFEKSLSSFY